MNLARRGDFLTRGSANALTISTTGPLDLNDLLAELDAAGSELARRFWQRDWSGAER